MKFLSTASLVIAALAAPILGTPVENRGYGKKCLTDEEATGIVKLWSAAFGGSVEAARKVAAENIEVYDNTVNFLFNMTIDTPYIKGIDNGGSTTAPPGMVQVASSPKPHYDAKFEVITMLHDCDSISFRWRFVGKSAGVDPTSYVPLSLFLTGIRFWCLRR